MGASGLDMLKRVYHHFFDQAEIARTKILRALPKGGVGVEIGVWKGEFSARIFKETRPATLHLVDPWAVSDAADRADAAWYGAGQISQAEMDTIHDGVARQFARQIDAGTVRIHRKPSQDALRDFADESVDYVYVDGDHSYAGVTADLQDAFRITRPGGFICVDDYKLGAWWGDDVIRAVHEMLVDKPVVIARKISSQAMLRKLKTTQ